MKDSEFEETQVVIEKIIDRENENDVGDPIYALNFKFSEKDIITGSGWEEFQSSLLNEQSEGKILNIVGVYTKNENNSTDYKNLGLARAESMRSLLLNTFKEEDLLVEVRMVIENNLKVNGQYFNSTPYVKWVINNEYVKEIEGKTLIYFPYNSTKEITTVEIKQYLEDLSIQLNSNPKQEVQIVGHTSSEGGVVKNYELGLERSNRIKDLLVAKGVEADRIFTTSKGEEFPVASNDNEEGKRLNRRTEVIISE